MSNYSDILLNDLLQKTFNCDIGDEIIIKFDSDDKNVWITGIFKNGGDFVFTGSSWTMNLKSYAPVTFTLYQGGVRKIYKMEPNLFGKDSLLDIYGRGIISSIDIIYSVNEVTTTTKKMLTPELFTYLKGLFDFYHDKCFAIIINKHYDNDDCCLGLSILCNKDYSQWFDNLFIENEELVKHLETDKKYDITEEVKSHYE